ncbi:MAG: hypothetical protein IPM29_30415 [Planctomycetes bacterium]|nr:hypothetical protein [Planctomycetota bacterium]
MRTSSTAGSPTRSLLVALLAQGAIVAQTDLVAPARFAGVWGGNNGSGASVAAAAGRTQQLYVAPLPAGVIVTAIAFRRAAGTIDHAAFQVETEIAMADTAATPGSLSTLFAANVTPSLGTVVARRTFSIAPQPAQSSPAGWIAFPASQPFAFRGPNALLDVTCHASTRTSPVLRLDRCFASPYGEGVTFGRGCGSATIDSRSAGGYLPTDGVTVSLARAPARQPAFLLAGLDLVDWNATPLPFDLGNVGTQPGCALLVAPIARATVSTDANGAALVPFVVPAVPTLADAAVVFQWLYVDPASARPLALSTTPAELVRIGPRSCPDNAYVYAFTPGALTGTVQAGGPIVRFTTRP